MERTTKQGITRMLGVWGVGLVFAWATSSFGQANDALLDLLVRKGIITQQEMKELKQELDADLQRQLERSNKTKVASWIDEMRWSGDLRLRYEYFDNDDQSNESDRTRFRYRARLGLETKFQDWAKMGLRFATGGEDPVSSNQSFDNTFNRDEFRIDLAYVTLTPPFADWVSLTGGKMNNVIWQPSFNSPMQYDFDVTPEGIGWQMQRRFGSEKRLRLFTNSGAFVLDEISADENDPYLLEMQGGLEASLGGSDPKKPVVKATGAVGFSRTENMRLMGIQSGSQPAGAASPSAQSTSPNRGNATRQPGGAGTTLFYLDDFNVLYTRGEVAWVLSEKPFFRTPCVFTFAGEYDHNFSDSYDDLNGSTQTKSPGQVDAWTAHVAFGGSKKKGEWQISYQYKYQEADSTWDALADSDWGLGGTDRSGHVVNGTYNVRDWWQLGCKAFITEKISSRPNSGENTRGKNGSDLLRVQADTVFKF
jgi:hypothetical protein